MNEIEAQVNRLFKDIPDSRRKTEIMQEITQNLNEKFSNLMEQGQPKEQAVRQAIEDFGDIEELRSELENTARTVRNKKTGLNLAFSVWGAILILALVLFINFYYTPHVIWFVYPAFAVIWWPMSLFFHWLHNKNEISVSFAYSVCGFLLVTGLMLFINFYYTPKIIWFVYPTFGVIWWPLSMLFYRLRRNSGKDEVIDD